MFLGGASQVLNIYAQVGLVMLIGLAGGSAILIVDLATQKMGEGESARRPPSSPPSRVCSRFW